MNTDIFSWTHKESASNYITGITENNSIDIIEGRYQMGTYGANFDVPVKVEFKKSEPYYLVSRGNNSFKTFQKELADEYKKKRHKVKYIENDFNVVFEWENLCSDGSHFWSEANRNLTITDEYKQRIVDKLNRLKLVS